MKTVVYPLTLQLDYTELRFSLRSLQKYLSPPFEVVIVSDQLPDWINNVTQIELADIQGRAMLSVRRKIIAALNYCDEILFMNDDFYLLANYEERYYSSGTLKGKGESGAKPLLAQLTALNKPTSYYGHYPAIYKKDFIEIIQMFKEECITKSAYLNCLEVDSIEVPDCKVMHSLKPDQVRAYIADKVCFSTGHNSLKSVLPILKELFPQPSIYEI